MAFALSNTVLLRCVRTHDFVEDATRDLSLVEQLEQI